MTIEKSLRIRRDDNEWAKAQKILYIAKEMTYAGKKIEAIQWLFKLGVGWMTLKLAYDAITPALIRMDEA